MSIGLYGRRESLTVTRNTGGLTVVTEPTAEPIERADAKLFARVESSVTADDGLFDSLIKSARRAVEAFTGRAIMTQTWDWFIDGAPGDVLDVPLPPLASVTGIFFTDEDGTEGSAVDSGKYTVDTARNRIWLNDGEAWGYTSLRSFRATRVRFVAGYGSTAADASEATPVEGDAPADVVTAVRRLVLEAYEGRGPDMPADVLRLLMPLKVVRL